MRNKKILCVLLAIIVAIAAFPVTAFSAEQVLCDDIVVYTQDDGVTMVFDAADVEALLDTYSRGRMECIVTELIVTMILDLYDHGSMSWPIYATIWGLDDNADMRVSRSAGVEIVGAFASQYAVSWGIINETGRAVDVSAVAQLHAIIDGRVIARDMRASRLANNTFMTLTVSYPVRHLWARSTLQVWEDGRGPRVFERINTHHGGILSAPVCLY